MVELLGEHGVEVAQLNAPVMVDGHSFKAGDLVVSHGPTVPSVRQRGHGGPTLSRPALHTGRRGRSAPMTSRAGRFPVTSGSQRSRSPHDPRSSRASLDDFEGIVPVTPDLDAQWGVALDPRDNGSYRIVFAALENGDRVSRAPGGLTVDGTDLTAGAFVIEGADTSLLETAANARAYVLEARPDGRAANDRSTSHCID